MVICRYPTKELTLAERWPITRTLPPRATMIKTGRAPNLGPGILR